MRLVCAPTYTHWELHSKPGILHQSIQMYKVHKLLTPQTPGLPVSQYYSGLCNILDSELRLAPSACYSAYGS